MPATLTMERISTSIAAAWFADEAERVPWARWSALVFVAVAGSLLYGASLALLLTEWAAVASAFWLALSAGLAWCVLIPVLCRFGGVRFAVCLDACLVTMAVGEIVLTLGALLNLLLWCQGGTAHGAGWNIGIVAISNGVMASVLVRRLRDHGVRPGRVWAVWMLALNGSGAVFFFLFHHWLLRP